MVSISLLNVPSVESHFIYLLLTLTNMMLTSFVDFVLVLGCFCCGSNYIVKEMPEIFFKENSIVILFHFTPPPPNLLVHNFSFKNFSFVSSEISTVK